MIDKANQIANKIEAAKIRTNPKDKGKAVAYLHPEERDLVVAALREYVERRRR